MRKPILVTENDIGITGEIMIKYFIVEHKFVEANEGRPTESLPIQKINMPNTRPFLVNLQ